MHICFLWFCSTTFRASSCHGQRGAPYVRRVLLNPDSKTSIELQCGIPNIQMHNALFTKTISNQRGTDSAFVAAYEEAQCEYLATQHDREQSSVCAPMFCQEAQHLSTHHILHVKPRPNQSGTTTRRSPTSAGAYEETWSDDTAPKAHQRVTQETGLHNEPKMTTCTLRKSSLRHGERLPCRTHRALAAGLHPIQ